MFAWIATRTGVQLPSPPIFACNEVESEGLSRRSSSESGLLLRCPEHEASCDSASQSPKPSGGHAVALAKADHSPKIRSFQFVCNFLARVKNKASHGEARSAITVINLINTADC